MANRLETLHLIFVAVCAFTQFLPLCASSQLPKLPRSQPVSDEDRRFTTIAELISSKNFQRAEADLDSAITHGMPPGHAYFRMGRIYFDHEAWARAATYLEKSLRASEENDQSHLLLGLALRELKEPGQAEKELLEAARQNPSSDVNAYFAGQQLLMDEKFDDALPYLYQAVKLNPRNRLAYRALGMAQAHLGSYGLAASYYRRAMNLGDESSSPDLGSLLDLSLILLLSHDPVSVRQALVLAQRAATIQPSSAEAHYLVGKALVRTDRVKEAVPELELAAKLNPEDSKAHFQLALAYDRLGEKQKARAERRVLAKTKQRIGQQGTASGSILPHSSQ